MERIPQSVTKRVLLKAYLASDHISDATSKTIAVTISKNIASFGNPSVGATNAIEIGNGWYYVDLSTTDTGSLGPLIVRGTAGTIDNVETGFIVVDANNAGLAALPAIATGASGAVPTTGTGANQIAVSSGQVLIQAGAAAGQLDFTSGVIKSNLSQILGTTLTETSGLIAAAFKKFFNVATPTGTVNSLPDKVPGATGGLRVQMHAGTAQAGSNTSLTLASTFTGDATNMLLELTTAGSTESRVITTFNPGTNLANFDAIGTAADNTTTYKLYAGGLRSVTDYASSADVATIIAGQTAVQTTLLTAIGTIPQSVMDFIMTGAVTVGSFGKRIVDYLTADISAINPHTDSAVSALATGANVTAAQTAINSHTDSATASLATGANVTAAQTAINSHTDSATASLATGANVTSAQTAINSHTDSAVAGIAVPSANTNADALLDRAAGIETGWTLRQAMRVMFAVLAGKASGLNTTAVIFRDVPDTKSRVTATVDSSGNRTIVNLDGS